MSTKFRFKSLFATALLAVAVIFGAASTGNAELEIPAGTHLQGPAILGTATLTNTNVSFVGDCKGTDVNISFEYPVGEVLGDISTITEENVEGMFLQGAGSLIPAACSDGADLTINTVRKFTHLGTSISAEVIILYVY